MTHRVRVFDLTVSSMAYHEVGMLQLYFRRIPRILPMGNVVIVPRKT